MAGKSKAKDFDEKRYYAALKARGYTASGFAPMIGKSYSDMRRYCREGKIAPDVLDDISEKLDVHPDYLKGSMSITKSELEGAIGKHLIKSFTDQGFDEDGFYFGRYLDYQYDQYQLPIDEYLIQFLNATYRMTIKDDKFVRYDFHKLGISELRELESQIYQIVEDCLKNDSVKGWKDFADTAIDLRKVGK